MDKRLKNIIFMDKVQSMIPDLCPRLGYYRLMKSQACDCSSVWQMKRPLAVLEVTVRRLKSIYITLELLVILHPEGCNPHPEQINTTTSRPQRQPSPSPRTRVPWSQHQFQTSAKEHFLQTACMRVLLVIYWAWFTGGNIEEAPYLVTCVFYEGKLRRVSSVNDPEEWGGEQSLEWTAAATSQSSRKECFCVLVSG